GAAAARDQGPRPQSMGALLAVPGWRCSQPRANGHSGTTVMPSRAARSTAAITRAPPRPRPSNSTGTSVWMSTSRFPLRRYGSSASRPSTRSSKRDSAWLSVTGGASLMGTIVASGPAGSSLRQVPGAQAVFLQAQVVVLLRLPDPLHAHPPYHCLRPRVGRPHDG